jgi:hypothetical protein
VYNDNVRPRPAGEGLSSPVRLSEAFRRPPRPGLALFVEAVLVPFAVTRAGLLMVAWLARQFSPSWTYANPEGSTRGWQHVPELFIDVWGRYDTSWYLDLATNGYRAVTDLAHEQSNLAFFPLYPTLVRWLHAALPAQWQGYSARFTVAVALSNACALLATWVVFQLVRERWRDDALARRTVLYMLLFPTGFFLSAAYSESLFLLCAAGAFLLAQRGRWWLAAVCAALATLSRSVGILVVPALALLYLTDARAGRRLRLDALSLLAGPAALAFHAVRLARLSGDPLALFHAQSAWGRTLTPPWTTLAGPLHPVMGTFELVGVLLFLGLGIALLLEEQWPYAAFTLLCLAPLVTSGTLMSATRLVSVIFPAFVPLARLGGREAADRALVVTFAFTQALFFAAWARFYWVA